MPSSLAVIDEEKLEELKAYAWEVSGKVGYAHIDHQESLVRELDEKAKSIGSSTGGRTPWFAP